MQNRHQNTRPSSDYLLLLRFVHNQQWPGSGITDIHDTFGSKRVLLAPTVDVSMVDLAMELESATFEAAICAGIKRRSGEDMK